MKKGMPDLLSDLPALELEMEKIRDNLLANLVMIGEIPAPTFGEDKRMRFLVERLNQYQLSNCSTDEKGNGVGILPGTTGNRNILVAAHLDTIFDEKTDHTITIQPDSVTGPGVGDNALGVAALATLPALLEQTGITFESNLILMGTARSLGKGNTEGLRFFLENSEIPIDFGLCIEGVKIGRISYSSIGMVRCELTYKVPEQYDWTRFGVVGSIETMNELINKVLEIPLPGRPKTSIVLGSIEGGRGYHAFATESVLRFEIRSESGPMVQRLKQQIINIAEEVSSHNASDVSIQIIAQRKPGGISFSHPLASNARSIMHALNIHPRIYPSTSELSNFIDRKIPALTIGLTDGENIGEKKERIEIHPIYKGLAQLVGLLKAIDEGHCNELE